MVDLRTGPSPFVAAEGIDVVVNAAGVEDPGLVATAADTARFVVDITATTTYVAAIERPVGRGRPWCSASASHPG